MFLRKCVHLTAFKEIPISTSVRVQNISGRHIQNKIRGGMVVLTGDRVISVTSLAQNSYQ